MYKIFQVTISSSVCLVLAAVGCAFTPKAAQSLSAFGDQVTTLIASPTALPTQEYIVQWGDTPRGVALMFGTTVETLIALNAERHPEMSGTPMKFNAGWRILVPVRASAPIASGGSDSQVIQSSTTVVTEAPLVPSDGSGGYFDYDGALEIIRLTNEERAKAGLAPLTIDETLMEIARRRATEIVNDWGHQGLDDDCPECGENIVKGGDVSGEFQWWMNSEGHRGGILWADYSRTGVGRYVAHGKAYAVQLFK
jgi:hypothetical protein